MSKNVAMPHLVRLFEGDREILKKAYPVLRSHTHTHTLSDKTSNPIPIFSSTRTDQSLPSDKNIKQQSNRRKNRKEKGGKTERKVCFLTDFQGFRLLLFTQLDVHVTLNLLSRSTQNTHTYPKVLWRRVPTCFSWLSTPPNG